MTICFDMDGTLADFYSVENWLAKIRAEDASPYMDARPLISMSQLARKLNKLHRAGHAICIVSWGSKTSSDDFLKATEEAKKAWLKKHLPSVEWDSIEVVPYGTPKSQVCPFYDEFAILFDDEEGNRAEWGEYAFDETEILKVLGLL